MIENLPAYIPVVFGLTTILTLFLFYQVIKNATVESTRKKANLLLVIFLIWLILQAILTVKNIYNTDIHSVPPKLILFGILPTLLTILLLFVTKRGQQFIDGLPLTRLTYLNIVRIPVELVLLWLFFNKAVPQLMTFEGRNFDILPGITAPFIAYFGFTKRKLNKPLILTWNFICLALLLNIVVNALLSATTPLQQFAFDQPNIAIVNFPFCWLPTFIVPLILFGHLVSIRRLIKSQHEGLHSIQ